MSFLPEPLPVDPDDPQSEMYLSAWMQAIYGAATNILLTSAEGAIQDGQKAGQLNAVYVVYTSNGTADTEDTVPHSLGRVPVGYIVVKQDIASIVYDSTTSHTSTNLYLKNTGTSVTLTLLVF